MQPLAAVAALAGLALLGAAPAPSPLPDQPAYDAAGRLMPPAGYREWVFLSSGLDMSYVEGAAASTADRHVFDNTFAPRWAYDAFQKTGVWPDKTQLVLEVHAGATKGSINKRGAFQQGPVLGMEVHVKDAARFKGGWGFFDIGGGGTKSGALIPYTADCYSCHLDHAAADTTFVQFYPTLLPTAQKLGRLSKAYLAEEAAAAK